jgi:NADPH2:quinone reductase
MRAVTCEKFGPPEGLVVRDWPSPTPGKGEVTIAAQACGVQFVDNRVTDGTSILNTNKLDSHYGRAMRLEVPFIPGMEAAGIVTAIGEGVTRLKPGDRVLGTCYIGAFAQEVAFQEDEVCRIPDGMDFQTAACFYVATFTAYYSLIARAHLRAGETVLILAAASGVGLAAVQIAKASGAKVIAAASTDEKLALAKNLGVDATVRYPAAAMDLAAQKVFSAEIKRAGEGNGPNVVIDMSGGTYSEPAMRSMAFNSRYISVGFSAGIPNIPMHVILNKNADLIGIEPASGEEHRLPGQCPEMMETLFDWYAAGKLKPAISDVFPLDRAGAALRKLLDRKATGRVVLTTAS